MRTTLVCIVVALVGCETPNSLFCDDSTPCADPVKSFCDQAGVYQETGKTCIAPPAESCGASASCQENSAPICGEIEKLGATGRTAIVKECRACSDGALGDGECTARDAATPVCVAGGCFECRVSADCQSAERPVCNESTNACVGCTQNADCASDVCSLEAGTCLEESAIVYLDAASGADSAACGGQAAPCQTIMGAQGGLTKVTASRKTLRLRGAADYAEAVAVLGQDVAFVGPATINPPADNVPVLTVSAGSSVSLVEMTVTGATGDTDADGVICGGSSTLTISQSTIAQNDATGIDASNCTLTISESTIAQNDATGIDASNCTLTISQSTIAQNDGGGLDISASSFDIQNNFVVANGTGGPLGSTFGGVDLGVTTVADVLSFNTIAGNLAINGADASGIDCQPTPLTASSNIVSLGTGTQVRSNCSLTHSNIEGGAPGTGNIDADPMFVNLGGGNFHLQPGSPCRNAADPAATLAVDFDGDPRPEGGRHDMGADEVTE